MSRRIMWYVEKTSRNMKWVVSIWQSVAVCCKPIVLPNVLESETIVARFHLPTSLLSQRSGFCSSLSISPHPQLETKRLDSSAEGHPRSGLVLHPTFAVGVPPHARSARGMRK